MLVHRCKLRCTGGQLICSALARRGAGVPACCLAALQASVQRLTQLQELHGGVVERVRAILAKYGVTLSLMHEACPFTVEELVGGAMDVEALVGKLG